MKRVKADYLIVGAGILGLSVAKNIVDKNPNAKVVIIDKEKDIGLHASGRNSGVLHAGFYYHPDSLKAKFTRIGNEELTKYCEEKGLRINKCGKVVVAKSEEDLKTLYELKKRGDANGVQLYVVDEKELSEIEPNAKTFQKALWSPRTAVVDPKEVINHILKDLIDREVRVELDRPYRARLEANSVLAEGMIIEYGKLVNCAGLYADKIAKDFGLSKDYILMPFKGVYLNYVGEKKFIKTNIYPVPNIKNPFLGVHFTLKVDGKIKIGPTAMPCFWRENYSGFSGFRMSEFKEIVYWNIKLFLKNPLFRATAFEELTKYIKSFMVKEASKLVKFMEGASLWEWAKPGIRPQLLNINTLELVQDFLVEADKTSVHVLNAVSPAFTASFPFSKYVVENYLLKEAS